MKQQIWNKVRYPILIGLLLLMLISFFWGGEAVYGVPEKDSAVRLSSLSIDCGELAPEFSPNHYEYHVYLEKDSKTDSCRTTARVSDNSLKIAAEGPAKLNGKDVKKTVTVTAANGKKTIYTIQVHFVKKLEILSKGKLYVPQEKPDLAALPHGFTYSEHKIKGQSITTAENSKEHLILLQYANDLDERDTRWYAYDPGEDALNHIEIKTIDGESYITVPSEKELLYGGGDEQAGYYLYDSGQGKIQSLSKDQQSYAAKYIVIGGAIITLLLCAILIIALRNGRKLRKEQIRYFSPHLSLEEAEDSRQEEGD
ncbi:cadherin-like beta sandwich domain-containing protein [Anaerovorax odorimutans]|uniref:Cadherin-like beta sandwich domain-containing protein n=1 Tax=Anaerovorax odorimutans TaxID=109327 RepID=A0ABT1RPT9_9FIRM|nr:cadherin-like beta sandwich domain-containing protein [Anaerovorax odorimutans]MCQ4637219.1 cadherin-like beta sandwich domain-containing protein [Anaerovorax odorimutans]